MELCVQELINLVTQAGPSALLGVAVYVLWKRLREVEDTYTKKLEGFIAQITLALHDAGEDEDK